MDESDSPIGMDKAELQRRVHAEFVRLQKTLDRLTPAQMLQPNVVGDWSVKDVLAHLIFWCHFPIEAVDHALRGEPFPHPSGSTDDINARIIMTYAPFPLEQVMQDWKDVVRTLMDVVRQIPEEMFEPGHPLEQALGGTLYGVFANNTYMHWMIHEEQIRAWLEAQAS